MSCDNIPGNGEVTENAVVGLAELVRSRARRLGPRQRRLSRTAWSTASRRRPADRERDDRSASDFGIEDDWPVFCEDFMQWVLEDNFPAGRPALEKVGVSSSPTSRRTS